MEGPTVLGISTFSSSCSRYPDGTPLLSSDQRHHQKHFSVVLILILIFPSIFRPVLPTISPWIVICQDICLGLFLLERGLESMGGFRYSRVGFFLAAGRLGSQGHGFFSVFISQERLSARSSCGNLRLNWPTREGPSKI